MATLTLKAGDTITRTITITDSAGAAVDITGGTVKFCIKKKLSDADADSVYINSAVTLTTPASGICTLTITKAVSILWTPGNYFWEIEYIDSTGAYSHTDYDTCVITKSLYSNG